MSAAETQSAPAAAPRWRTLERHERRVAGVLAEKAKTTPDNYPMSLNAIVNGANQKSNRFPQMTLDEAQVQDALDSLRKSGAVSLIQGDGRVEKYRHLLYDWLGVDKPELAVMTELLLRGAQTLGELRGRAARMEPIKDIGDLMPIVDRLRQKNLLIYLSSLGRGGVVTHNLYQPQELDKLRAEQSGAAEDSPSSSLGGHVPSPAAPGSAGRSRDHNARPAAREDAAHVVPVAASAAAVDIQELRQEVAALKREFAELREQSESAAADLRRELEDLKTQLGV